MTTSLAVLVAAAAEVAAVSGRNDKVALIAAVLGALPPGEAGLAAAYLSGAPPQDRLEVGWATVKEVSVAPVDAPGLRLTDVDAALTALATAGGPGSRTLRMQVLGDLLGAATEAEQVFLRRLVLGDMRQGALAGVVTKGIAVAAEVPETVVRRALMLSADLVAVTTMALAGGRAALQQVGLQVGRGVQPMLAATAGSVTEAVEAMGSAVVEWKLDGMRVQVHRDGDRVVVLTRNLNDITDRSPLVVEAVRSLPVTTAILDGEILTLGEDDRPVAFQDTMSHVTGSVPFFFDLLHVDGEDLIDLPLTARRERLHGLVGETSRVPSVLVEATGAGEAVLADALAHGHEGVMVKSLDGPYAAGRRGKDWRKVKPVRTLDLVVLAVEWGSGRRTGMLSNIHLGARDDRPGNDGFVMLGKTFKGMTDEMLRWQTERFLSLETHREEHVVHLRPEQVVEIALDGIQTSRRYPGGVALRFARVLRYRQDKAADEADTLGDVLALRP